METEDHLIKLFPPKWRAPVVITAGVVLQFTLGLVYTFGNILPYLTSYIRWKVNPEQTQGSLIWLQSLMSGFPFSMLTGGYLERLLGARWGAAFGSVIYTGSLALSYFSIQESYFLLIVTMGLFASFGIGVTYNCWLPHRVGLVSGIITAGFGGGAFIISPVQTKFINPENLNVNEEGYFTQTELLERVPQLFLLLALIFGVLQFIGLFFLADPKNTNNNESVFQDENEEENKDQEIESQKRPLLKSRCSITSSHSHTSYGIITTTTAALSLTAPTISTKKVLNSDTFICLFLTLLLNGIWVQTTSGLFKAYGQTFIHDDFFLATVSSFAAATNCFSRIFWGAFADRASYRLTMSIACSLGAALMWTLGLVELLNSSFLFFIWICAMFSCVGATYSLVPYATHRCFGCENFGVAYGCVHISLTWSPIPLLFISEFGNRVIPASMPEWRRVYH
uniref:Oxalate:formate antiporter n=1 Tax=Meloidogyne incognita TaxID=6306 RepID=A0A914L9L9_MELIC